MPDPALAARSARVKARSPVRLPKGCREEPGPGNPRALLPSNPPTSSSYTERVVDDWTAPGLLPSSWAETLLPPPASGLFSKCSMCLGLAITGPGSPFRPSLGQGLLSSACPRRVSVTPGLPPPPGSPCWQVLGFINAGPGGLTQSQGSQTQAERKNE